MQRQSVAHTSHFNAFRLHSHTQFGMFADSPFDDIRDVFQGRSEIFESEIKINKCGKALSGIANLPVIAQGYIIRQMGIVTNNLLRGIEFS